MTDIIDYTNHPLLEFFSIDELKRLSPSDLIMLSDRLENLDDNKADYVLLALKSVFQERTPTGKDIEFLLRSIEEDNTIDDLPFTSEINPIKELLMRGRGRPRHETLADLKVKHMEAVYSNAEISKVLRRTARALRDTVEVLEGLLDEINSIG
jgi:hypothetical protein